MPFDDDDFNLRPVWCCPWCGEVPTGYGSDVPDNQRNIMKFNLWLEGHSTECETFQKEMQS